jgi:regulator of protease activity HflC (stomatin/prohibitin superfamily)
MNIFVSLMLLLFGIGAIVFGWKTLKTAKGSDGRDYRVMSRVSRGRYIIAGGSVALLLALVTLTPFTIIAPGHVGVKVLFGKVDPEPLYEGFNLINPLASVVDFDTRVKEYTMVSRADEGSTKGDDSSAVLSKEGLQLSVDLTTYYRLIPKDAPRFYMRFGKEVIPFVRPSIKSSARDVFAKYDAVEAYSTKREEVEEKTLARIKHRMDMLTSEENIKGIEITGIQVRDVSPPATIKVAIEEKQKAEQESQRMVFVLMKEKQEAERKKIEAQGIQDFQNIVSKGINQDLLQWKGIEATELLAKSPNSKVVIIGSGKNGLPIILNQDK